MTGNCCSLEMDVLYYIVSFSPDMPESEATFAITSGGISDAKD